MVERAGRSASYIYRIQGLFQAFKLGDYNIDERRREFRVIYAAVKIAIDALPIAKRDMYIQGGFHEFIL